MNSSVTVCCKDLLLVYERKRIFVGQTLYLRSRSLLLGVYLSRWIGGVDVDFPNRFSGSLRGTGTCQFFGFYLLCTWRCSSGDPFVGKVVTKRSNL